MSLSEKVALVASVRAEYSLTAALSALEIPKATWYYHTQQKVPYEQKYAHLRPLLEQIAREHPAYGIPRITRELRDRYGQRVNHKVVQRLLQSWELALLRSTHVPEPSLVRQVIVAVGERANLVAQLEDIGLFEVAYTDFTELLYADGAAKAYLMSIIDHTSKFVYGWAVGEQANTELALQAWQRAKQTFRKYGISCEGMIVHHDQDAVYTGYAWTGQLLLKDKVQLSYALDGAKDNPAMESFNSRFKAEGESLFLDAADLAQLEQVVAQQMSYHNTQRRHSSLGYLSPLAYLKKVWSGQHKGKSGQARAKS
jgi:transposase InsO family protein